MAYTDLSERTDAEKAQSATDAITSAMDSVTLINSLLADTSYTSADASKQVLNTIDRNYRHLEIVLARDVVINYNGGADLTPLSAAASAGKAYIVAAKAANNANASDIVVE